MAALGEAGEAVDGAGEERREMVVVMMVVSVVTECLGLEGGTLEVVDTHYATNYVQTTCSSYFWIGLIRA
jgi:hypothetical protein